MSDREELLKQAEKLELDFPKNVPTEKLSRMIQESLEAEDTPTPDAYQEEKSADEKAAEQKAEKEEAEAAASIQKDIQSTNSKKASTDKGDAPMSKRAKLRMKIAEAKKKAFATSIVTITNKDPRENDVMTTTTLSFENQYFGLSKIVPLDVPVELEKALIDIAESTRITLHKEEVVNGRRTGNKVPVSVKKFVVSYSRQQPGE